MGRTASPVTPGASTAPAESTDTAATSDLEQAVVEKGLEAEVATSENAKLQSQVDELRALVMQLSKNQVATALPEQVKLPTMKETMAKKPEIAVLTEEGWYVPAVHPTDRLKG